MGKVNKEVNKQRKKAIQELRKLGIKIPKDIKKLPWIISKQNA